MLKAWWRKPNAAENSAVPGIVVKIPVTAEGLAAIKLLNKEGIRRWGTAVYSAAQGCWLRWRAQNMLPYVNRVDAR